MLCALGIVWTMYRSLSWNTCLQGKIDTLKYLVVNSLYNWIHESNRHWISSPIKHSSIIKILDGISKAMYFLHEKKPEKIIHRDLSSKNVLVIKLFLLLLILDGSSLFNNKNN